MIKEIFQLLDWLKIQMVLYRKHSKFLFNEGEIWWCHIGMNVGVEIYGKGRKFLRPVLILKKLSSNAFFGLPLTSQPGHERWRFSILVSDRPSFIVLDQGKMFDSARLYKKIMTLEEINLKHILSMFLGLFSQNSANPPEGRVAVG